MSYIENIYVCLAAPLLLLILCLRRDARRYLIFLLAGMTACLLSAYVSTFVSGATGTEADMAYHEIAPVVEEFIKFLPLLFYLVVFEPEKRKAITGTLMTAVGFATFENVCFLIAYGTSNLMRLMIRGFGTGAMHLVCGMVIAVGLFYLWDQVWLRIVGTFALLCVAITFHAVFNVLVNQIGPVFWVGTASPLTAVVIYLLFFREKAELF